MIRNPDNHGILSNQKESNVHRMEVSVISMDVPPQNTSTINITRKKKKRKTRFELIETLKKKYPGCSMSFVRVDTDGYFTYKDKLFCVTAMVPQYDSFLVDDDKFFNMDQILILDNGQLRFYDQAIQKIDPEFISFVK